jgi:Rrf2 family protein
MKMSTKGRYGVRAMVHLAVHYGQGPLPVRKIADRMDVSAKYLDHLMTALRMAGLIRSIRKAQGGYLLAKSPKEIRLSEVIRALEGSVAPVDCVDDAGACRQADFCTARDLWKKMQEAMDNVLESINLDDMAQNQKMKWNNPI